MSEDWGSLLCHLRSSKRHFWSESRQFGQVLWPDRNLAIRKSRNAPCEKSQPLGSYVAASSRDLSNRCDHYVVASLCDFFPISQILATHCCLVGTSFSLSNPFVICDFGVTSLLRLLATFLHSPRLLVFFQTRLFSHFLRLLPIFRTSSWRFLATSRALLRFPVNSLACFGFFRLFSLPLRFITIRFVFFFPLFRSSAAT